MAEVAAIARTVTIFIPPSRCNPISLPDALTEAVSQAKALRKALEDANITVQTTRLALHSPAVFHTPAAAIQAAKQIAEYDIDYFTLGNVFPKDEAFLNTAFFLTLLRETPAFISCTVAQGDTIFAQATHVAASVVMGAKQIPHGAFRFGALANVNPGSAFFPSAYAADSQSRGEPLHTCIGIQGASSLSHLPKKPEAAKQRVRDIVEILAARVVRACKPICDVTVDFSTAPFPGVEDSAARTVAHVGDSAEFGGSGYVAGAALLASALQTAEFQRGGLCGVMLPYAEDVCLAGGRRKSVGELLLASAVCGTGLDVCICMYIVFV